MFGLVGSVLNEKWGRKLGKLSVIDQVVTVWADHYQSCGSASRTGVAGCGSEFYFYICLVIACLYGQSLSHLQGGVSTAVICNSSA